MSPARGSGQAPGRTASRGGAAPRRLLTDRRILERRRAIIAERVRRRRLQVLIAAGLLVVAVGLYQLARSPLFGLSAVRVEGVADPALRAEVIQAAALRPGEPYLPIDPGEVRRRVEALPRVEAARVGRAYPSSLRIQVTERPPTAVVRSAGAYWLVAADGTVLGRAQARPAGLPYVANVPLPPGVAAGARLEPGNPLANALGALGGMDPDLRRQVTGVAARSIDSLEFTLRGGAKVLYGAAEQQAAKDAAVLLVQTKLRAEGKQVMRIDVRNPSMPTVQQQAQGQGNVRR